MAKKIGCIVMYSKPLEKYKTIPRGTVFYSDGTEEEVSLKEAAEKALEMALEYGYINAIDNERYYNTTYEDFINNKENYINIAKGLEKKPESTKVKNPKKPRKLPDNITEVDPPSIVIGQNGKPEIERKPEKIITELQDEQDLYAPPPPVIEYTAKKPTDDTNKPDEDKNKPDDDLDAIEDKIHELLNEPIKTKMEDKTPTQEDLLKMIQEQNSKVTDDSQKKR